MRTYFKQKFKTLRYRLMISEAFGKLKRQVKGDIELVNEYAFKKCCASLIETCGFIPDGFVTETATLITERRNFEAKRA